MLPTLNVNRLFVKLLKLSFNEDLKLKNVDVESVGIIVADSLFLVFFSPRFFVNL